MIGELLGHYRIVSKIGQGGMGVVYRAHDEVLQRDVALKVVGEGALVEKSSRENLLREARSASALSHPNICTIHEVGEFGGELYMVMELIDGKTLKELIGGKEAIGSKEPIGTRELTGSKELTGGAGLAVESILRYGVQIAAALVHAHSRNFVHHDLKSANVVVTPQGLVKVLDFGLATRVPKAALDEATASIAPLEGAGAIAGTLPYMAPEVLCGQPGDFRSDLWALGVVLYEAAAGQLPFRGRTSLETCSAILHELPAPPPDRVPPGLWAIIQRCLAKEPAQRYQQAGEVQAALEAVQSSSSVPLPQASEQRGPLTTVLRGMRHLRVKDGDVLLMVGTVKGAFLLRSGPERRRWDVAGPYFHGLAIYSLAYDGREGRHRLWASTHSYWGTFLVSSEDFGKVWTNPQQANIRFPPETGTVLNNIWQISLGRPEEPDVMYCGVEPAALFESRDAGETWSLVRGLFDHPHRPRWRPGNGGLTLHTIAPHPSDKARMCVAISAGGMYKTEDGGASWRAANRGVRNMYQPDRYPEFGQCVHKFVVHPARPERHFLQNHWGLYRSDDGAESWKDIANGVPSDFGFAMVMHPHNPDCVYIVPVESDEFRCAPEGRLRVYRTRNAGASWEPLSRGLPQKGAYETVLRDAMTADALDPAGLYFGTRSGHLYGSADEGKTWKKILEGLPAVVCVKSAVIGEPRAGRVSRAAKAVRVAAARARRAKSSGGRPSARRQKTRRGRSK
ncbi:MAG TPA: protein kinase [Terriglobia bacterium]|nr:protein kinase [Terriglobia bacterium]